MKFIASADNHIVNPTWQRFPRMVNDSLVAMEEVFTRAREDNIPIISAGDLFDEGQDGTVSIGLSLFTRESPSDFWFIVGNHEVTGYAGITKNPDWLDTVSPTLSGVRHLSTEPFVFDDNGTGRTICGIDYCRDRTDLLEKLEAVKAHGQIDILVLHQAFKNLLGHDGSYQLESSDVEGLARLVIVGDIHTPAVWESGGTTFISPGATVARKWSEVQLGEDGVCRSNSKLGYYVVELTDDDIRHEHVKIRSQRPFVKRTIMSLEAENDFIEFMKRADFFDTAVPEFMCAPVVSLRCSKSSGAKKRIEDAMETIGFDTIMEIDVVDDEFISRPEDRAEGLSTVAIINRHVDKAESPQVYAAVSEILAGSERPDAILTRYVEEITSGGAHADG